MSMLSSDYHKLSISNGKPRVRGVLDTLELHSAAELKAQLDHYSRGVGGPVFLQRVLPDSGNVVQNQRIAANYVEYIRPALRFYCNKFGVAIPSWLKTDAVYTTMSKSDLQRLFGKTRLDTREFRALTSKTVSKK